MTAESGRLALMFIYLITAILTGQVALAGRQPLDKQARNDGPSALVVEEIRYHAPEAGDVWLVWGINGWKHAPETLRPPGTIIKDNVMHTPLIRVGNAFSTTLRLPPATVVDYGFLATQIRKEPPVTLWEGGRSLRNEKYDTRIDFVATASDIKPEQIDEWVRGKRADLPLVEQDILYVAPGAGEVWLVWGGQAWENIPESLRPSGTVIIEGLMRTPMTRHDGTFTARLRLPPGMTIEYGFLISRMEEGTPVHVWEYAGDRPASMTAIHGMIDSPLGQIAPSKEQRAAWLAGQSTDISLTTQNLRYRVPDALEVWLLWGIDEWKPLPQEARPLRTVIEDGVMKTAMSREGDVFSIAMQFPPGAAINYKFLLTRPPGVSSGKNSDGSSAGALKVRTGGSVTVKSSVTKAAMAQRKAWPSKQLGNVSLVSEEIRYRIAGAGEVWLEWGINGWQPVPEEARPPGTILMNNVIMRSRMVQKGDVFTTTVRIPPDTMLNYNFIVTKTSRGAAVAIRQDLNGQDHWKLVRTNGSLEEKATVSVVSPDQRKAWLSGQATDLPLVTQEIRYHAPGAAEVWFEWGLEGWQTIPEASRPSGTMLNNGRMQTHLIREGTTFTTTVRLPPGTQLDYGFLITKTEKGTPIDIRQEKDEHGQAFSRVVAFDDRIAVQSTAWLSIGATDLPLVAQEIRYRIAGAEEVWLVWGINGWQAIPEEARPPGTMLKNNKLMQTRMVRKGDTFATTIQVPKGTKLDYKFLITKTSSGVPVRIWQDHNGQDFRKLVRVNGSLEEKATVTVVTMDQRKAWLAGQTTDLPLVTQEIRYRAPGAADVWLIWGLDGWQTIPEAARPPGTVLNNGRMQTHLLREGTTFTTTVRLPPGTQLDYGFLIAKAEEGTAIDFRQEKDEEGRAFAKVVMFDGRMEIRSLWNRRP